MTNDNIVTYLKAAMKLTVKLDYCPNDSHPPKLVSDYENLVQHINMLIMVLEMESKDDQN